MAKLPRVLTVVALSSAGCSPMPPTHDAGVDAGCTVPSDFPADASASVRDAVCNCPHSTAYHCYEEGGPRCFSWSCYPQATPDGGYVNLTDGGVQCLC
jgi:hypothetical protein